MVDIFSQNHLNIFKNLKLIVSYFSKRTYLVVCYYRKILKAGNENGTQGIR